MNKGQQVVRSGNTNSRGVSGNVRSQSGTEMHVLRYPGDGGSFRLFFPLNPARLVRKNRFTRKNMVKIINHWSLTVVDSGCGELKAWSRKLEQLLANYKK
jgi:hypothetical protein